MLSVQFLKEGQSLLYPVRRVLIDTVSECVQAKFLFFDQYILLTLCVAKLAE